MEKGGRKIDIGSMKEEIKERMPGLDVDNLSPNDLKKMVVDEINNNKSLGIDNSIKEKINSGDIEGLKEDIIEHLSKNKSKDGSSEKLVNALKNNDMEGLKNQLMGMLLGGIGQQKKNEIGGTSSGYSDDLALMERGTGEEGLTGFNEQMILSSIMGKAMEASKDDNRVHLLTSMRPFVSQKRQKTIDDCIRIISLFGTVENFFGKAGK